MKNYLSITNDFLKNRIYKLIIVLAAMGILDVLAAFLAIKKVDKFMLGYVFSTPAFYIVLLLGFVLCTVLCLENKTKKNITDIREYYCMAIANALTFVVLWLVQAVFIIVLAKYLANRPECSEKSIGLFIDFERTAYMHVMLPIADVSIVIRNIVFAICFGINLTVLRFQIKNKEMPIAFILLILTIIMEFTMRYGNTLRNYIFAAITILLTVACIIKMNLIFKKKQGKEVQV